MLVSGRVPGCFFLRILGIDFFDNWSFRRGNLGEMHWDGAIFFWDTRLLAAL